jgi:mono/diheme cytochrome c family protein
LSVRSREIDRSDSEIGLAHLSGQGSDRRANPFCRIRIPEAARPAGLRGVCLIYATSLALFCASAEGTSNQTPWEEIYKSNWAGIYTNDQAARGQSAYRSRCAACHGATLEGSDDAPPLAGPDFVEDWNCANIADLFEKIQYTMPGNRPGRLEQEQVAEILSYILRVNLFPAGNSALPANVDDLRCLLFFAQNPNPR